MHDLLPDRKAAAPPQEGAVSQSLRIAFRALQLAMLALVVFWVTGNVRRVPPEQQALVLRFGRAIRVQQAGLVYAWPRPFEEIVLLPGPSTQQGLAIDTSHRAIRGLSGLIIAVRANSIPASAGAFLTGDNSVVILEASISWRVTDAIGFYLAGPRIAPALQRLFAQAATEVAAGHELDDFLAVRPERATDPNAQSRRQAIRGELAEFINTRLRRLQASSPPGLGVEATRVDLTPMLPLEAKDAFDRVLLSGQKAEKLVATARTDALTTRQAAEQERDATLAQSRAAAVERVSTAQQRTATVSAFQDHAGAASRPSLLEQVYRERIAKILQQAGGISAIDVSGGNHIILPGARGATGP